jgi:hypothetical protein
VYDDQKHDNPPELHSDEFIAGSLSQTSGNSDRDFNTIKIFEPKGVKDAFTHIPQFMQNFRNPDFS